MKNAVSTKLNTDASASSNTRRAVEPKFEDYLECQKKKEVFKPKNNYIQYENSQGQMNTEEFKQKNKDGQQKLQMNVEQQNNKIQSPPLQIDIPINQNQQLNNQNLSIQQLQSLCDLLQKKHKSISKELKEALEQKLECSSLIWKLRTELQEQREFNIQVVQYQQELKERNSQIHTLQIPSAQDQMKHKQLVDKLNVLQEANDKLNNQRMAYKRDISNQEVIQLKSRLEVADSNTCNLQKVLNGKQIELNEIQQSHLEKVRRLESQIKQQQQMMLSVGQMKYYKDLEEQNKSLLLLKSNLESQIQGLLKQNKQLSVGSNQLQGQVEFLKSETANLSQNIKNKNAIHKELETSHGELKHYIQVLTDEKSQIQRTTMQDNKQSQIQIIKMEDNEKIQIQENKIRESFSSTQKLLNEDRLHKLCIQVKRTDEDLKQIMVEVEQQHDTVPKSLQIEIDRLQFMNQNTWLEYEEIHEDADGALVQQLKKLSEQLNQIDHDLQYGY